MEKQFWGLILLCFCLSLSAPAIAEERVLPVGTEIRLPNGAELSVKDQTHFLVERSSIDRANAARAAEIRLNESLKECQRYLITATETKKPIKSNLLTYGAGLGIALSLGVAIGISL